MKKQTFVGFGFGPIQSGIFAAEAFKSGNFSRLVIAEIDRSLIEAVNTAGGSCCVNVAGKDGITAEKIENIEMFSPANEEQKNQIAAAIADASAIATSLPSIDFYDKGHNSVAKIIAEGLAKNDGKTVIYTAENNNHAAEALQEAVSKYNTIDKERVQFLNTVIGKMSQVTSNQGFIKDNNLKPITPSLERAFLVEEFNRILVSKTSLPGFNPGIEVFVEKEDLMPFEEAKLYGHNAIHSLIAYLGIEKGFETMDQIGSDEEIMTIARAAFINESGAALINKYSSIGEELFTPAGYKRYAEDLLERMTNPYLSDSVARAARDPQRKLGYRDRIFGTMRMALDYGIEPVNLAKGAKAGVKSLLNNNDPDDRLIRQTLKDIWQDKADEYGEIIVKMLQKA